ncbi:MAG: pimeloyl-ACP methyl ester carboxylesterase [Glaciecola sp.]|jgi:pimeloyl-ACP methyl ester carboxylesterase
MTNSSVRAQFVAVRVPGEPAPHDTIAAKIHYPAAPTGSDSERLTGVIPADTKAGPLRVVIFIPGVNVGPESYGWLATHMAARGYAFVTYQWIAEVMPGMVGITPGIDLEACRPENYGSRPTATAVRPLLDALAEVNEAPGPLQGALDLTRVALGGHSGGATVAFHASDHRFFPEVKAVFGYAGHTVTSTMLGWEPNSLAPVPADCPVLLMGGTRDGVMARSADRYGIDGHGEDPVTRTYKEAITDARRGPCEVVIFEGANHFAIGYPEDPTVARGFLDLEPEVDPARTRSDIAARTSSFLARHMR